MPAIPPTFLQLALQPQVMGTASKMALLVGCVLMAINHGAAMMDANMTPERWVQVGLTFMVPYCVSTYSAVKALQRQSRQRTDG